VASTGAGAGIVGRVTEREALRTWLDDVLAGRPRVIAIEGAAGIGKSTLARWFAERARTAGARVLSEACVEDGGVPFLPVLGALAPIVAVDELVRPTVQSALATPAGVDPDRLRLFSGCAAALTAAAEHQPVVLIVEDVHWADEGTTSLLSHLLASLSHSALRGPTRIGLLFTARRDGSPAVDRLTRQVRREPDGRALTLGGLEPLEVHALLNRALGSAPAATVSGVWEATEGNPLFVQLLIAAGHDEVQARDELDIESAIAALVDDESTDIDALWRQRLDRVGPAVVTVLAAAAVARQDATLPGLATVLNQPPDEIRRAVDVARSSGLVHEVGQAVVFSHPYLRHVVLARLPAPERRRLELVTADCVAEAGPRSPRTTISIAEHLVRAGDACPPERRRAACLAAADAAFGMAAWSTATQMYTAAIGDDEAADLLIKAGTAAYRAQDLDAATRWFGTAVAAARTTGDVSAWGRAVVGAGRARLTGGGAGFGHVPALDEVEQFLHDAADAPSELRALALALLSEAATARFDGAASQQLLDQARQLAEHTDDVPLRTMLDGARGLLELTCGRLQPAAAFVDASTDGARRWGEPWATLWGQSRRALVHLAADELRAADEGARAGARQAAVLGDWAEYALAQSVRLPVAVANDDPARAEELADRVELAMHRCGYYYAAHFVYPPLACSRARRGDRDAAEAALDRLAETVGVDANRYRVLVALADDDLAAARERMARAWWRSGLAPEPVLADLSAAVALIEAGHALAEPPLTAAGERAARFLAAQGVRFCPDWPTTLDRSLGQAALASERMEEAEGLLGPLAAAAGRPGATWESATASAHLARARLARGDPDAARRRLEAAVRTFLALGAAPAARAATRWASEVSLPTVLGPGDQPLRIIVMTDIVGSTSLNVRLGDEAYVEVLRAHDRIVRAALRRHGGIEFKHSGDGVNAWFEDAASAVRFAIALQDELDEWNRSHSGTEVHVRCGMSCGRPIPHGGDLFGVALSEAARVCALADGGDVFLSEAVRALVPAGVTAFAPVGRQALRGFSEAVTVFAVQRR
jgi:class 3 adenylate cyclase